jgi:hypothetical protein
VGLVDDEHVVLGEHRAAAPEVGTEQVEIDDHDVSDAGLGAGTLGEAVGPRRASMGTRALVDTDADRRPRRRVRLEFELGSISGVCGRRPLHKPADVI